MSNVNQSIERPKHMSSEVIYEIKRFKSNRLVMRIGDPQTPKSFLGTIDSYDVKTGMVILKDDWSPVSTQETRKIHYTNLYIADI